MNAMAGCERCPICHLVPMVRLEPSAYDGTEKVFLRCEQHGHVASGANLDEAVKHWNIYLEFIALGGKNYE